MNPDYDFRNNFRVVDDFSAEKCIISLKEKETEKNRLQAVCNQMIDKYKQEVEHLETMYQEELKAFTFHLESYVKDLDRKETKTQFTYKLPSAKVVTKKESFDVKKPVDLKNVPAEYIKTTSDVDWAKYKKKLQIVDNVVIDDFGEVVDIEIVKKEEETKVTFI